MNFEIEITRDMQKDIKRLARRAAMIEAEIAAMIRRVSASLVHQEKEPEALTETAEDAFNLLLTWCEDHPERIIGRGVVVGDHVAGRWLPTDDHIYLFRDVADRLLRDGGYRVESVLQAWRTAGWIKTAKDQLRYTKQMRVIPGQKTARVYALRIPEKKLASPENNH